jgi:exonuclease III
MELGYQVALNGAKGYAGVATLTKGKPDEVIKGFREPPEDSHCRILNVFVCGVRIYNLYVPNGTALGTAAFAYKLQWLERLRVELDANSRCRRAAAAVRGLQHRTGCSRPGRSGVDGGVYALLSRRSTLRSRG